MNRRKFLGTSAAIPVALSTQSDSGYRPLFDGKSLDGWVIEEGPESAFFVSDGAIVASQSSKYPTWLRSSEKFENFEFRCEFFIEGWIDGGVCIHAACHGRPSWTGMMVNIFHQVDEVPKTNSMGAIFPLIAPSKVNVKSGGQWNSMTIRMDWPRLQVWTNDEKIQDLNLEDHPDLRHRLRQGYLGFISLGYPIRFRGMEVKELPSKERWNNLYVEAKDFDKWWISESSERAPARFQPLGGIIRAEGGGHLATREKFKDFELQLYIRGPKEHNGGILVRSGGRGLAGSQFYEIQIHNVAEAHYPTGSLYHHKRSIYPRIEDEKWFPMQIRMQGRRCLVRVNGETVLEYDDLEVLQEGYIELQAHRPGSWLEFKEIRVKRLKS